MKTLSVLSTIPIIAASIIMSWLIRNIIKTRQYSRNARTRAQAKRKARDQRRQELLHLLRTKYSRHLPDRSVADSIAQSTATELIDGFRTKRFTYAQVTLVMCLRALKAGLAINCVTEEFYDEAMERAIAMDESRVESEEELLLKGIPISLKDQINQRNADSSMGMVMRNFRPSTQDSLVLELLKEQGALGGFARTATVQAMMVPDSDSLTYGQTYNPFNLTRTPGGSSGGECALIACRGSPLGIGSDLGGSIRIPAHFCGLFGFKPTPGRVSEKGVATQLRWDAGGETNIRGTVGPLARCTDDLVLVMRSWLKPKMWHNDPAIARQPWREERYTESKNFTIGYYTNDDYMPVAPACIRAVEEAADALRQLGHTLVPYKPFDVYEAVRLYVAIVGADGLRHCIDGLENEPPHPMYGQMLLAAAVPRPIRTIVTSLISLLGEKRNSLILKNVGQKSADEYFDLVIDLKKYTDRWMDDMRKNKIDLLLTPVNALPAYRLGQAADMVHSCSYTLLFNILHMPAGAVPVTLVRNDEQFYKDIGGLHNDRVTMLAKNICRESSGLPIGVQLAGWPNDDERVLNVMRQLENSLNLQSPIPALANDIDIYSD